MKRTLYENGPILTLAGSGRAHNLLVEGERIAALNVQPERDMERVNLKGRALLPGFIDSHSHLAAYAQTQLLCPLSGVADIPEIVSRLAAFEAAASLAPGKWLLGFGYDPNTMAEGVHPTREALDAAFPRRPVMITHASGHMGVVNSRGLERLGLTADSPDPEGGRIGRDSAGSLTGYLEEKAFTQNAAAMDKPALAETLAALQRAQGIYAQYGITTCQDGLTGPMEWGLLEAAARERKLQMDVVCYADLNQHPEFIARYPAYDGHYVNRLKMGGWKIILDGSPQGRTAWMLEPYQGTGVERGYPVYSDEKVRGFLFQAIDENRQILVHCNGDAAASQLLRCYERALAGRPSTIRPVMIHAQLVRREQLYAMARLGIIPSFFAAHVWYWGDTHVKNFGLERASQISPAAWALEAQLPFTLHQDTPVIAPNMMETVACAVNRRTREGLCLGPEQRLSPLGALRGITANAAYQYFEEYEKGTLAPGKQADLVILEKDPLAVSPEALGAIAVTQTICRGETVYQR